LNTAKELTVLDTHNCMDEQIVEALYKMEQLDKEQYSRYVSDVARNQERNQSTAQLRETTSHFSSDCTLVLPAERQPSFRK